MVITFHFYMNWHEHLVPVLVTGGIISIWSPYVLWCLSHSVTQSLCALVVNWSICVLVPIFIYCYGFILIWTNTCMPWFLSSITVMLPLVYEPINICFCSCFSYCHGFIIISTNPYMPWFLYLITVMFSLLYEPIHICLILVSSTVITFSLYELIHVLVLVLITLCFVLIYFDLTELCPGFQQCLDFIFIY